MLVWTKLRRRWRSSTAPRTRRKSLGLTLLESPSRLLPLTPPSSFLLHLKILSQGFEMGLEVRTQIVSLTGALHDFQIEDLQQRYGESFKYLASSTPSFLEGGLTSSPREQNLVQIAFRSYPEGSPLFKGKVEFFAPILHLLHLFPILPLP